MKIHDLVIIGAGPAGIAAAYEAKLAGLEYVVIEKGLIGNTIYNYPVGLTVFSTVNELEIEPGGLDPAREKPTREELLSYYVRFVLGNDLDVRTEEAVLAVSCKSPRVSEGESETPRESEMDTLSDSPLLTRGLPHGGAGFYAPSEQQPSTPTTGEPPRQSRQRTSELPPLLGKEGSFLVETDKVHYFAKNVLFAIGAMDRARKLNVPGEDLPHVFDVFRETYPWVKKKALIVGGGNSAGEAALFLAQEGAETTLAIFRDDWESTDPKQGCIKYWVKQPLEDELKENCLNLFFLGKVIEFRPGEVELESETGERVVLENDVVFVLIGSDADLTMMKNVGVATEHGKYGEVPVYDPETFETNVPGIYVAGHFTNQRHIKGAIDGGRTVVQKMIERLTTEDTKDTEFRRQKGT